MNENSEILKLKDEIASLKSENDRLRRKLETQGLCVGSSVKERYGTRILNALPDMLTVFDHEGHVVEVVSSERTNHVGISNDEAKGKSMYEIIPKDQAEIVMGNIRKVIATNSESIAYHQLDVDGVRHDFENRVFPLDEKYVLVMCRDISLRMKVERAMKKSHNELRELNNILDAVINNIPVYLFVKDPENDFRYMYWNKAFANYSKIPTSKAIGRTDFDVFPRKEDAQKFRNDDLRVMASRERLQMQETYESAIGEARIVQTLKTTVPLEGRGPLLIGVSWDVTDMQNVEQDLIQARLKAEQSDRLKTAFLANMSHEIRTPLNAIVGFSNMIVAAESEEEKKMYSDIINENSEVLLQLITDILDLSKIEAGTLEYFKRPMDLGEVCRNIYEIHKDRVKPGVKLTFDNMGDELFINEDKNRIMQVITNLITNAIKFTNKGEIRYGYSIHDQAIHFYVRDTGIGISADKIDKIFDRFVKLNSFVQGTGLGLPICQLIVEKIGGKLAVKSEFGKGTCFEFTIPYKGCCEKSCEEHIADISSDLCEQRATRPLVLVAEDVESNFMLVKSMIGKCCDLLWAHDGEEALQLFKDNNPDAILMDIKMPKIDGYEATKMIRQYSSTVPIIALTAFAFEADRERALEVGCNDFLTKPFSRKSLEGVLSKYLKH